MVCIVGASFSHLSALLSEAVPFSLSISTAICKRILYTVHCRCIKEVTSNCAPFSVSWNTIILNEHTGSVAKEIFGVMDSHFKPDVGSILSTLFFGLSEATFPMNPLDAVREIIWSLT